MFVVILKYKKSIDLMDKFRPIHLEFLDVQYKNKTFIMSGRQNPMLGGVIIANCNSKDELWSILKQDIFYKESLVDYEITEFNPNKMINGLSDLIK